MLTKRQEEVLEFLRRSRENTGLMPSTREIQVHFGFASQTAAVDVLRALERKGTLRRLPGKARGIILNDRSTFSGPAASRVISIPVHGVVAAGYPDRGNAPPSEYLRVDAAATGLTGAENCFALRVRGDSMMGAHILDGDFVILDSTRPPRHRDIVAALIDGHTTLKRLMIEGSHRWLKAENPLFPDLVAADELLVQGVMRGLIRGNEASRENEMMA